MRQLKNTNLALVFVDCCQSDVVAQKVNSGDRSNCTMDPSDGNMPLGQDIPDEFNADNGLLLGDYFSNILTAKGIFFLIFIDTMINEFRTTKKSRRNMSSN